MYSCYKVCACIMTFHRCLLHVPCQLQAHCNFSFWFLIVLLLCYMWWMVIYLFRELGHLFYEITSKLDNKENNKSVIVGTTITSKSNENNNCKVTHESGSNSSEEEGDNVSVSVNAGSADEPPQYDHSNYHIYKKYSSKYALKRDVFLQNLAFRDWLTDNNI